MIPQNCPVTEGEELNVEIESIGAKGDGIAKKGGYTIFVPETEIGDTVNIRIERVLPQFAFAKKIEEE